MSQNDFFVDLHCHPNLKSFNSGHPRPIKNLWEKIEHACADNSLTRLFRKHSSQMLKESQANLYALANGNVRVAVIALYPIEKGFLKFRKVPGMIFGGNNINDVLEHVTGMGMDRVKAMQKQSNHYFHDLVSEYEYVRDGQGSCPQNKFKYKLVNNFSELEHVLKNEPDTLALILSIEGAHALGCGNPDSEKMSPEQLKAELTKNIRAIKSWEHVPFSINLAHHFWNQLCGHAPSIKPPFNKLVNQNKGLNKGLTELGRHVLRELLGRENGKRIYIDTKHMSVAGRKEYYGFVRNYNFLNPNDKIPIFTSHTAVNGFKDMDASLKVTDHGRKSRDSYFHRWSLNISDEEIRIIHESEGMIGVMMEKGNLGGGKTVKKISSLNDEKKKAQEFSKLIWSNVFQIIKAVDKKSAWDIIGIGSDYDGGITHVDNYPTAENFCDLKNDLIAYLHKTQLHRELWYGYKPKELVNKIMRENAIEFLRKYFRD